MSTGDHDSNKALTRREFDEVIRRAAELAAQESDSSEELQETDLFRIADDVGLPAEHVRQALSEVKATGASRGIIDRWYGPATIVASRVVPGTPNAIADKLDEFLIGGRLLQRVRRTPDYLHYRPAVDWISTMARAASSTSRRYYVASAKSVEARLSGLENRRTHVEFVVDPGIRSDWVTGGMIGGGFGGLVGGTGMAMATATITPELVAVGTGIAFFGGILAGVNRLTAAGHKKKRAEIQAEIEGILDALEADETLEPPPPSWRKWVEKQFHGARRLLEPRDDDVN